MTKTTMWIQEFVGMLGHFEKQEKSVSHLALTTTQHEEIWQQEQQQMLLL